MNIENMSISDFLRLSYLRWDGRACIATILFMLFSGVCAYVFNITLGRYSGLNLALNIAGVTLLVPIIYISLVYFSVSGRLSEFLNAAIVFSIPVLFYIYA